MRAPVTVFFDTSFISEAPLKSVKFFLDQSEVGFITDKVLEELQAGYDSDPHGERFSSIFGLISDYRQRNNLKVISLKKCTKDAGQPDFNSDTVFIKQNSLLCSGYYAWLPCCVNPSMVTDPFRHAYNSALYTIRTKGDHDNEASTQMGRLRAQEIGLLERQGFKKGGFTVSALKKARKKRLKDIKRNNFKVTDYGLVVTSFLYLCHTRKNVILLTCDYDLHDIKDNLIRSAIEKYTLNNLLTGRLKDHDRLEALETGNIRVSLTMEEIHVELNNVLKRLRRVKYQVVSK